MTLFQRLGLQRNPFEHYTAETEPDIGKYAIRPPYLEAIQQRVKGLASFILFGDRGAGKSATRITVFTDGWKEVDATGSPFIVNLTDFTKLLPALRADRLTEMEFINVVAFQVIEQMMAWLASLEESDRAVFIEGLDASERTIIYALLQGFYLSVSELDRNLTTDQTLKLLNTAWRTKSGIWLNQRWTALSQIVAAAVAALARHQIDEKIDIEKPAEALLKSLKGDGATVPRAILGRLVEFARAFGFSGVAVLIDKVDETAVTSNSAEATTRLIHPLLSHIQLMEVEGFCWVFFLWSKVKEHFQSDAYPVRLDKLAHADIGWSPENLRLMIESRVKFFSDNRIAFHNLFESDVDVDKVFADTTRLAIGSPRELIKLLDTISREHDAREDTGDRLLDLVSVELGQDKYVTETIGGVFPDRYLQQVFRMGMIAFVNKDVQAVFKIGDQAARAKIQKWQDIGLVRQNGTQAPAGELGGQPAYRFVIADARVERIISRKLVETVGAELEGEPDEIGT